MVSFTEFKNRGKKSLAELNQKIAEMDEIPGRDDDRFWQLTVDKAGNGYAVIRFLPEVQGEEMPFIRMWDHGFQGPGGWYIERSLTTIGKPDPVSEYNTKQWNAGNKDFVSGSEGKPGSKRRLSYVANIMVLEDPAKPENQGKVFLFRFGKKIYEKLDDLMNPKFPGEVACNPFDFWEGANFKLKARKVEGYRNYDKSEFDKPSALNDDDQILEKIWKSQYPLKPLNDESTFKTYDELKTKLYRILDVANAPSTTSVEQAPKVASKPEPVLPVGENNSVTEKLPWEADDEDGDEFAQFKALASR